MALPQGLRQIGEAILSKPKQSPTPPSPQGWELSGRVDGVTTHDADLFYADGITPAMRAGFSIEAALLEQRHERQRAQYEAPCQPLPPTSLHISPRMAATFDEYWAKRQS